MIEEFCNKYYVDICICVSYVDFIFFFVDFLFRIVGTNII